jgi:hypothetical protein
MHTYRELPGDGSFVDEFEVGYWRLDLASTALFAIHVWEPLSLHTTSHEAMLQVNFLNGGSSGLYEPADTIINNFDHPENYS